MPPTDKGRKTMNHDLITSHLDLANSLAWSFAKSTQGDFKELQAAAYLALCEAAAALDPSREVKLSTLAYHYISNALKNISRDSARHTPTEHHEEPSGNVPGPARLVEFKDSVSSLSPKALEMVKIVLEGPTEILGLPADSSRSKIRAALRKRIGRHKRSREIFSEIKKITR